MKIRSEYISNNPEHARRIGGRGFYILEEAMKKGIGTWFSVKTLPIMANEISDLEYIVRYDANVLSFVKGDSLIAIDGDFKLSDLGLTIHSDGDKLSRAHTIDDIRSIKNAVGSFGMVELTKRARASQTSIQHDAEQFPSEDVVDLFTQGADPNGAKMAKRAGTLARPVAVRTTAEDLELKSFKVMVLPESPTMDGWGVVNGKLLDAGIIQLRMPDWMPEQRTQAIRWWDRQMVFNCRAVGDLEFVDSDDNPIPGLLGHLKFQVCRDDGMRDDIAFITSMDSVKKEMHPVEEGCGFAVAIFEPQGKKDAFEDQQTVTYHPFLLSQDATRWRTTQEARKAFTKLVRGEMLSSAEELHQMEFDHRTSLEGGEAYNHMLRWRTSAWVLYGMSYFDSKWLTEQLGRQWTQTLNWGTDNWRKTLRIIIPGAVRAQVISASAANLHSEIDMHPEQGTPEWCSKLQVLVMHDDDWVNIVIPSHGGCDQDDFFVIRWVTIAEEMMDNLRNTHGFTWLTDSTHKILITRNPNARGEYSLWNHKEGDFAPKYTTSEGEEISFPEITKKRWPKQILQALKDGDTKYLQLPTAISLSATVEDDRQAVLEDQQATLERIYASGKPVDEILAQRLGLDDVPSTDKGIVSMSKKAMEKIIRDYLEAVYALSAGLDTPAFLAELGNNEMLPATVKALKQSRRAQYITDQMEFDTDDDKRRALKEAQEKILLANFGSDRVVNARLALALWYAACITPTSKGRFTDQSIFGTDVFNYLLDGLLYMGIAHRPGSAFVWYEGEHQWTVECRNCHERFEHLSLKGLIRYWNADRLCKSCRTDV